MELGFGEVAEVGTGPKCRKDLVVLTPHNQRSRLVLAKERLKVRIQGHVGPIVVEEVELDVSVAGPIEQGLVVHPVVGTDARDVADAVGVLELRRLRRDEKIERPSMRL